MYVALAVGYSYSRGLCQKSVAGAMLRWSSIYFNSQSQQNVHNSTREHDENASLTNTYSVQVVEGRIVAMGCVIFTQSSATDATLVCSRAPASQNVTGI